MKNFALALLAALLLDACARDIMALAPVEPVAAAPAVTAPVTQAPAPTTTTPFVTDLACHGQPWNNAWNTYIADALDDFGPTMLAGTADTKTLAALCPGYTRATAPQRHAFWTLFMASIACPESSYNPNDRYRESNGTYSEGLLQLSYGDERGHPQCEIRASAHNILDPRTNLRCGVAIFNHQLAIGQGIFQTGHFYYWSTLRRQSASTAKHPLGADLTLAQFHKYAHELTFCDAGGSAQ